MKKMIKICFLLAVLCLTVPVYAEGDLPAGNRNCTLSNVPTADPRFADNQTPDGSAIEEIYSWFCRRISELIEQN